MSLHILRSEVFKGIRELQIIIREDQTHESKSDIKPENKQHGCISGNWVCISDTSIHCQRRDSWAIAWRFRRMLSECHQNRTSWLRPLWGDCNQVLQETPAVRGGRPEKPTMCIVHHVPSLWHTSCWAANRAQMARNESGGHPEVLQVFHV